MTADIVIDFTRSEGAVLRLIGQIERRGFEVVSMTMAEHGAGPARLTLGVASRDAARNVDTLRRHVAKIHGVTSVHAAARAPFMERAS